LVLSSLLQAAEDAATRLCSLLKTFTTPIA